MAIVVTMPRLSDTMTEGTVASWLKKVGDKVAEGDILAEIETDKATMEFESFNSGTLLHIGVAAGESAACDALLAIIGDEGEDISDLLKDDSKSAVQPEEDKKPKEENQQADENQEQTQETTAASTDEKITTALPKGVVIVTMPRLSDTMTEGTVASWLKNVGDKVAEGDILAEIETDKATMEFESFNAGTLLYIGVKAGESAPCDSVLAVIGPDGTDMSTINLDTKGASAQTAPAKEESAKSEEKAKESGESDDNKVQSNERIFISPLAKKIADEKGLNINQIKGSGENGRIIKSDVENFTATAPVSKPATDSQQTAAHNQPPETQIKPFIAAGTVSSEEIKNSQMRKVIAKRLSESIFTAPHFYLTVEIAMDEAMKSRVTINALPDTKVSFNDMVIKACAMALKKHLKVNSQWKEEATIIHHHVNIGVAVAVEDGLVVPVLPFTDLMSLTQIGGNVKDLASRAKSKKLQPAEMEGSTFTISNLGMFGITEFTSIINQPNSAILSVGAIVEKPVVRNGQIVVGNTMKVTLACDHRTVDGATGAQFLQTLRLYLENPVTMLA